MWPWGHLAFGYLCYSLGSRIGTRTSPGDRDTLALAVGTQFPDLIDKPLAWWVGVLPGGRTLTHSLLVAVPLVALGIAVGRRYGFGLPAVAFGVGYGTHLVGDAIGPLTAGRYGELAFLLWPATPTVVYEGEASLLWHLTTITLSPLFVLEGLLVALVVGLWIADGAPVLSALPSVVSDTDEDRR